MSRRSWVTMGLLTLLALGVRLYILRLLPIPEVNGDALGYTRMATQLLTRHIYGFFGPKADAYVSPGYPLFLTAIQWLAGTGVASFTATRLAQVIIGALTIIPFYLLAVEVADERAGFWTALLLAFYPSWVRVPAYLLTETLFTFAFGWYLWAQVRALRLGRGWRWPFATGLLLGVAVLVRPAVAPLLLLPWLYPLLRGHTRDAARAFAFATAGFALILLPWWIRNVVSLHRLVLLAAQAGNPILGGMDPYGHWHGHLWSDVVGQNTDRQMSRAIGLVFWLVRNYPWLTLKWFTVGKLNSIFMTPWLQWELPNLSLLHVPVLTLGWLGAFAVFRPRRKPQGLGETADTGLSLDKRDLQQVLSLIVIALTLVQLAFIPESRYAYPLMGILSVFAALSLSRIFAGGEPDAAALAGRGSSL
ncbi:MAG: glycosyltransferase family 39 protein [Symbiobacteriia bacterium]